MSQTKAQLLDGKASSIEFNTGSASSPTISFTGDTNTGIYSPGGDQVAISTNGTGRLLIDSTGVVAIGGSPNTGSDKQLFQIVTGATAGEGIGLHGSFTSTGAEKSAIKFFGNSATSNYLAKISCIDQRATDATDLAGDIAFYTRNGSSGADVRLTIKRDGKVGIGTTSPAAVLHISNAAPAIRLTDTDGDGDFAEIYTGSTGNLVLSADGANGGANTIIGFNLDGSEKARIDSSGRLLVGTSTARSNFFNSNLDAGLQIENIAKNNRGLSLVTNSDGTDPSVLILARSNADAIGSNTLVTNNQWIGTVSFQGNDGAEFVSLAQIDAYVDGTPGANDMPGRLVFSTTPDSSASPVERMRIEQNSRISCGPQAGGFNAQFYIRDVGVNQSTLRLASTQAQGTGWYLLYGTSNTDATLQAWIRGDGTYGSRPNVYGGTSDIRLKENIDDAGSQWNDIKNIEVKKFNFIGDETRQIGVIAQQVETVSPGLVDENEDKDEKGNPLGTTTKFVKYSVLYMKAVKALQEAMERIETLEQRLNDAGIA